MDHFDVDGPIDDQGSAAIWEWQSQNYYGMHKHDWLPAGLPHPSSSFWDTEDQFYDIADIKAKDFEEWNETSQAKRRRMLQFSPENVEMTCPMTEGGLSHSLQVMDSSGTDDKLPEEWQVNCLQDVKTACFPAEEMNSHIVAMEKAVETISAEPAQDRPAILNGVPNTCPPGKNIFTITSDFSKPCNFLGEVTLEDINGMIKAKPTHKNDEEPNLFQAQAISGRKPMVHKRRIHAPLPHEINHCNDKKPYSLQQVSSISGKSVVHKIRIRNKGNGTIITIGPINHRLS